MVATLHHFIGGEKIVPEGGIFGDVYDPAVGEVRARAPYGGAIEIDAAVRSGLAAQEFWAATSGPRRAGVLFDFRALLIEHKQTLADLLGCEHGKTIADSMGEIQRGIDVVEFACGLPHLLKGEYSSNVGGNIDIFSYREPVGIVGGITPFNFPVMIPLWMGVMAIACGNAFINKPSEKDPSAALFLGELWQKAGLPDGIWNIVIGAKEAVDALIVHPDIAAISFVGSTRVGEYVYQQGCVHNKRVQAFCGAKNHMVVLPDADLDQATDALIGAGFGSAGERCMAISAVVPVGRETADKLIEKLIPRVEALKIGHYSDVETEVNPLISQEAKQRVESLITGGVEAGATLHVDGRGRKMQGYENGYFVGGTLFGDVNPDMEIYRTEIFGPVLSVMSAVGFDEAVDMVNAHEYGNGVAIYTRDGDTAQSFAKRVDIGMIGINVPIPVPMAFHHFGGAKRSKFGDTQMHGPDSVKFFTKLKTISARWPTGIKEGAEFAMPTNR